MLVISKPDIVPPPSPPIPMTNPWPVSVAEQMPEQGEDIRAQQGEGTGRAVA